MCYLVAKKFDKRGCVALKAEHGRELADLNRDLSMKTKDKGTQIIVISNPTAYKEYAPYKIVESQEEFIKIALAM